MSKNSMHRVAYRMNPDVVPIAAEQGKRNVTGLMATAPGPHAKCSLRYALSVAKILKCLSSPERIDLCIVMSATMQPDRAVNIRLTLRTYKRAGVR